MQDTTPSGISKTPRMIQDTMKRAVVHRAILRSKLRLLVKLDQTILVPR